MVNKTVIGVNFITCKGSDLVIGFDVLVKGIIVLEIVPHLSYWETGMLKTKLGVNTILKVIIDEVVGGVNPIIKPD